MSAEWVTAIATAGTFVVIAASAVAALLQLRHMRRSNEIELIQNWAEGIESEQFQRARAFVSVELPRILKNEAAVRALSWELLPDELAPVRTVCNHFEAIGTFIKLGSIEGRVACELWGFVVLDCWQAVAPVVALLRRRTSTDALWENFEYLAVLAQQWLATIKDASSYPHNAPRMPEDRSLIETLSAGVPERNAVQPPAP